MTSIQKNRFLTVLIMTFSVAMLLSACALHEDTWMTENRVQVKAEKFVEEVPLKDVSAVYIRGLSQHYEKHGDGPIYLTVTYDPRSKGNTAMKASQEAGRIVRALHDENVRDVKADILPIKGRGSESSVVVSYVSYTAEAPKGCTTMPGLSDTAISHDKDYRMGCTIEAMFARQVAHSKDLLGRGREDLSSDGRRAANMGELHRSGLGNQSLDGETASE